MSVMAIADASVRIVPDTSKFAEDLKKNIQKPLKDTEDQIKETTGELGKGFKKSTDESKKAVRSLEDKLEGLQKAIAGAFVAKATINFAKSAIAAAEAAEQSRNRIQQVVTSMNMFGDQVSEVTDRLVKYAETTAMQTGIDDDQIQAAQAKLLTFKSLAASANVMGGDFDRATKAAMDLGAVMGGDVAGNARILGRALENPTTGMNALRRAGIIFTEDQKALIKSLMDTNQVAEAQNIILSAVEQKVGGAAEATATASQRMKYAYGELQEEIGKALLPALQSIVSTLIPVTQAFAKIPQELRGFIVTAGLSTAVTMSMGKSLVELAKNAGMSTKFIGNLKAGIGLLNAGMIAFSLYQQQEANNAAALNKIIDKLTTSTKEQVIAQKENLEVYMALAGLSPEEMFKKIADASLGGAQRMIDAGTATELFGISVDEANAIIAENVRVQDEANKNSDAAAKLMDDAASASNRAASEAADYATSLGFVVDESGNLEMSQENLALAVDLATKRYDDAVKALDDYKQGLEEAYSAARSSIDTGFALVEAQDAAAESIKEYDKATKNGKLSTEELDKVAREASKTILDVSDKALADAEAKAKMSGATLDAAAKQALQIESLEAFRDTLDPSSPLYQYINGFIDTLGTVPTEIPVEMQAEVDAAKKELDMFKDAAKEIGTQITIGILEALAPISPEFQKMLDKMRAGLDNLKTAASKPILFDVRVITTTAGGDIIAGKSTISSSKIYIPPVEEKLAVGGIIDQPQVALIGEAGREAVIPLTRPARALELMRESGLLGLAQQSGALNQNFDIRVEAAEPIRTGADIVREFQALSYRMNLT